MNEELNVMENNEMYEVEETGVAEFEETTGGSLGTVIKVGAGLLAVTAGAAVGVKKLWPKVKTWNTERKIRSLNRDGYAVFKSDEVVDVVEVDCDDSEEVSDDK